LLNCGREIGPWVRIPHLPQKKVKIVDNISNIVYIYKLKNNNYYKQQKLVKMKKILALITIVTLVSCGNQNSTEVKTEDTTMVADSTMTLDSTSTVVDSAVTEGK
jgi:hypothetical protein